jgi:hypothetical protein
MRFGLDYDDPRRVAKDPFRSWQRWFAWRPVQLNNGVWVWWETVEYKLEDRYVGTDVHYRLLSKRGRE